MAKLAIVRPETRSDLKSLRLYLGPHWRIGKRYWAPRASFVLRGCPLNWRRGSSGKKVSLSLALSLCKVLLWGGGTTWCTSMAISRQWEWCIASGSIWREEKRSICWMVCAMVWAMMAFMWVSQTYPSIEHVCKTAIKLDGTYVS